MTYFTEYYRIICLDLMNLLGCLDRTKENEWIFVKMTLYRTYKNPLTLDIYNSYCQLFIGRLDSDHTSVLKFGCTPAALVSSSSIMFLTKSMYSLVVAIESWIVNTGT